MMEFTLENIRSLSQPVEKQTEIIIESLKQRIELEATAKRSSMQQEFNSQTKARDLDRAVRYFKELGFGVGIIYSGEGCYTITISWHGI